MTSELAQLFSARMMGFLRDTMLVLIFVNAYLSHAPDQLPGSLRDFPQWLWGWNLNALRAFISSRMVGLSGTHSEWSERADGSKKTVTDTVQATDPKAEA